MDDKTSNNSNKRDHKRRSMFRFRGRAAQGDEERSEEETYNKSWQPLTRQYDGK
jgi:hypothetical protein